MTVNDALAAAIACGVDRLDAAVLLASCLERERTWLIAHGDAPVGAAAAASFTSCWRRRLDGVPVAYLTGEREFYGLRLLVSPGVLVPRPETETLVDWAIELLNAGALSHLAAPNVVDLGTGSGAIALAVAANCRRARVTATDESEPALRIARVNAERLGLRLDCVVGDWWQAVDDRRFDLALANPPYVASDDVHLAALQHEPREALVADDAGLADIGVIVAAARQRVSGWILIEHGWDQAPAVRRLLAQAGGRAIETRVDLAGQPRCTGARIGAIE